MVWARPPESHQLPIIGYGYSMPTVGWFGANRYPWEGSTTWGSWSNGTVPTGS